MDLSEVNAVNEAAMNAEIRALKDRGDAITALSANGVPKTPQLVPDPPIGGKGLTVKGDLAVLFSALCAAQANYAPLKKTRENPYYSSRYADLSDVLDACLPALHAEGFALLQPPVRAGDAERWTMFTILGHKSGGYFQLEATVPAGKWQEFGSAVTYCRRYQVSALAGVAAEPDDDGNLASDAKPGPRANTQPTPPAVSKSVEKRVAAQAAPVAEHVVQRDLKPERSAQTTPAPGPFGQTPSTSTLLPAPTPSAPPPPAVEVDETGPMTPDHTSRIHDLIYSKAYEGSKFTGKVVDKFFRSVLGPDVGVKEAKQAGHAVKLIAALELLPDLPSV